MSKWIKFNVIRDTGLTKVWEVNTIKDTIPLGHIRWYSPWRKYCFFPLGGTVYAASCLGDIADFIKKQMDMRKLSPKEKR